MQAITPALQSHTADDTSGAPVAPPTSLFLSTHAHCCEFGDGAIILDLRSDTYLGIDAQQLCNLRMRVANWPVSAPSDQQIQHHGVSVPDSLIAALLNRGILTTSPTSRHSPPATNPTSALTLLRSPAGRRRVPLTHVVQFLTAFVVVMWRLKRNGLPSLVDWLRRRQSAIDRGHSLTRDQVARRLESFLWLRTWCYTARDRCLFDSLVLSVYLTRGMIPCILMIGVATKPFFAHAWVQIGEWVLNDTAEHAQDFTPIFSVGDE
jgi:hypothetical protein